MSMLIGRPTVTRLIEPRADTLCKRIKRSVCGENITNVWRTPSGATYITVHNSRGLFSAQVIGLDEEPIRYQTGDSNA